MTRKQIDVHHVRKELCSQTISKSCWKHLWFPAWRGGMQLRDLVAWLAWDQVLWDQANDDT